ncbi:MAG TPA: YdjY domain-containing protein [Phycisphaerales bacterium]|nr:YdjY domain-containing protein [Phycisphaerales bacterium]HMP36809.1 YdjY domain-containing protein [Phycisphaerales bacterium]
MPFSDLERRRAEPRRPRRGGCSRARVGALAGAIALAILHGCTRAGDGGESGSGEKTAEPVASPLTGTEGSDANASEAAPAARAAETAEREAPGSQGSPGSAGVADAPERADESGDVAAVAPAYVDPVAHLPERWIETAPGVRVDLGRRIVSLDAEVCIDLGWLEQIACTPGTREHESLVVLSVRPRDVHAALLLLGLEPGAPGAWRVEEGVLIEVPPRGPALRVRTRRTSEEGVTIVEPIERWIRDVNRAGEFPETRWVFAGSVMVTPRRSPAATAADREAGAEPPGGDAAFYLADRTGSVVGLVTFGDEVVAFPSVIADQEAVQPQELEAFTERLPPIGTRLTLELLAAE